MRRLRELEREARARLIAAGVAASDVVTNARPTCGLRRPDARDQRAAAGRRDHRPT